MLSYQQPLLKTFRQEIVLIMGIIRFLFSKKFTLLKKKHIDNIAGKEQIGGINNSKKKDKNAQTFLDVITQEDVEGNNNGV